MTTTQRIDWSEPETAAKELAGNWQEFNCFAWHRAPELADAGNWAVIYTSNRDSGLVTQSNEAEINKRLQPFSGGSDPDLIFERHDHWAAGYMSGFSIRVYAADGTITPAFCELCRINETLDDYSILNEPDYAERELIATLENYAIEMWRFRDRLPKGWEAEVYNHFSETNQDDCIQSKDDQGGWASRDKILQALESLGLLQVEADTPIIVNCPA